MADSAKQFLIVDDKGNGHLKVRQTPDGPLDHGLMGGAHAALFSPSGYGGQPYDGPGKEEAKSKLRALYKSEGLDWPEEGAKAAFAGLHFVVTLSHAAGAGTSRQALAVTGNWVKYDGQKISVTPESLNQMISNFAKVQNGEVNVDYDHASENPLLGLLGPSPSAGRITKLYPLEPFGDSGRQVLFGDYEPTEKARELISKNEYRFFSIAGKPVPDSKSGKPQGWTLTSVALTNRPVQDELPQIRLSEGQELLLDSLSTPASAGKENKTMKNLTLKNSAEGKHQVFDGDEQLGEMDDKHLKTYAQNHLGMTAGEDGEAQTASNAVSIEAARATLLSEIGAADKTPAQVKELLAQAANPPKSESVLLSETVNESGIIDRVKLDALTDSNQVRPSAQRRALDAESRVAKAFSEGRMLPGNRAAALKMCLSDPTAFETFIEKAKPVVDLESRGATPAEGVSGPNGEGPATMAFSAAIKKRMDDTKESYQLAEINVIRSTEGLKLYEAARREQLEPAGGRPHR